MFVIDRGYFIYKFLNSKKFRETSFVATTFFFFFFLSRGKRRRFPSISFHHLVSTRVYFSQISSFAFLLRFAIAREGGKASPMKIMI